MRRVSHLLLHPSPEAPDACIVPAAGPPGHGLPDPELPELVPVGPCGIVDALVRACPDVVGKVDPPELVICVQNGPLLHRDGAFAGKRHICLAVQDSGHADEALVHAWEVGDVGGDDLEGSAAPEVPVHGIGRHLGLPVLADRAAGPPALPLPHDAGLPHDALHLPAAQSAGRRA